MKPDDTLLTPHIRVAKPNELESALAIDEDAGSLFADIGLALGHLTPDHPFVRRERERWAAAIAEQRLYFACTSNEDLLGFVSFGTLDGQANLDQLAVRKHAMRRGVGRALLEHALHQNSGHAACWLTTYDHVAWNRAYYERHGFTVVREAECGPGMQAILREERACLPHPHQRVAMRRSLG